MHYLKQSTAVTLKIGPFLDDTDGKTAETALSITQADVRLSKDGGNMAQKTEGTSCTHDELGIYGCPIDATDTNTLGRLQIFVHESGALPAWHEYMVIPANVFDSMFSTDKLEVDLNQIGGVAQSVTDLKDFADAGYDPSVHKLEACKVNDDMVGTNSAALASVCTEARLARLNADISTRSSHTAADIWSVGTRGLTDKAGFGLSTAGILAIWHQLTANIVTASTIGKLLKDDINATISSRSSHSAADIWSAASRELSTPANYKADVSTLALEASLTDIKGTGFVKDTHSLPQCLTAAGFSTHTAANVWAVGTRALTDKAGFSLAASQEVQLNAQGKLDVNAEVDTGLADIHLDHLLAVDTGAGLPGAAGSIWHDLLEDDGGAWRYNANSLEQAPSGGTNPNVLISTTIASVTDQTHFTLTIGSNDNDAYKNQSIVVYDASDNDHPSIRKCTGYVGATKTVTIDTAPDFTIIAGDGVKAFVTAPGMTAPTAGENADAIWDEAISGHTGVSTFGAKNQKVVPSETLADYKATGFSTHTAANVWTAANRALSTPADYKADVSSLALEATLTAMKGATFVESTDSLEAIRNQGDAAWLTAAGFSTHAAADVWGVVARTLTDKTGFGLSSAAITAIWEKNISAYAGAGYAGTYIKTLYNDWVNAGRLDLILDTIAADVVNIDGDSMRGTDSAALSSVCTEGRLGELDAANMPSDVDDILADTSTDGVVVASGSKTGYALSAAGVDAILDEVVEGTTTFRQMLRLFLSVLGGKSDGGGTVTLTFRDLADGKNRITATVDANGNRTAMALDGT